MEKGAVPFIGNIFEEIQSDLGKRKQLPTYTWNNKTNKIKLKKNKGSAKNEKVETMEIPQHIEMPRINTTNDRDGDESVIEAGIDGFEETDLGKGCVEMTDMNASDEEFDDSVLVTMHQMEHYDSVRL